MKDVRGSRGATLVPRDAGQLTGYGLTLIDTLRGDNDALPVQASAPIRGFTRTTHWPIQHPPMYRLRTNRRLSGHGSGAYYSRSRSKLLNCEHGNAEWDDCQGM